jgi:hypothetical protein
VSLCGGVPASKILLSRRLRRLFPGQENKKNQ